MTCFCIPFPNVSLSITSRTAEWRLAVGMATGAEVRLGCT